MPSGLHGFEGRIPGHRGRERSGPGGPARRRHPRGDGRRGGARIFLGGPGGTALGGDLRRGQQVEGGAAAARGPRRRPHALARDQPADRQRRGALPLLRGAARRHAAGDRARPRAARGLGAAAEDDRRPAGDGSRVRSGAPGRDALPAALPGQLRERGGRRRGQLAGGRVEPRRRRALRRIGAGAARTHARGAGHPQELEHCQAVLDSGRGGRPARGDRGPPLARAARGLPLRLDLPPVRFALPARPLARQRRRPGPRSRDRRSQRARALAGRSAPRRIRGHRRGPAHPRAPTPPSANWSSRTARRRCSGSRSIAGWAGPAST